MGYDISYFVACKVLGCPCLPNNMTLEIGGNTIQVIYPSLLNQTHHSCSMNHTNYLREQALQDIQSEVTTEV